MQLVDPMSPIVFRELLRFAPILLLLDTPRGPNGHYNNLHYLRRSGASRQTRCC